MRKILLLLLMMLFGHVAVAAEPPAIGYVDVRKVMLESKTGKKNRAELEMMIKEKEGALKKEEQKLKAMQEAFQKDQLMMTDAQKQQKQKEFQEKAEAFAERAPRPLHPKDESHALAEMWVTPMRLAHVLDAAVADGVIGREPVLPDIPTLVRRMIADVQREGEGELGLNPDAAPLRRALGARTVQLFKAWLRAEAVLPALL